MAFLSDYAKTDDRIQGLIAGGDDYLGKPYDLTELELREVRFADRIADFSTLEFDLLTFFGAASGAGLFL